MTTSTALIVDGIVAAGFGLQHSLLASVMMKTRIRKWFDIDMLPWRSVESLVNVCYILLAATAWQHTAVVVWQFTSTGAALLLILCGLSWAWYWQLHLFEYDCGLAFGSTALVSYLCNRSTPKLIGWKVGSRRWIRFPVHTAFFGMFFLLPTMTADLLVLAVFLNVYNIIGSVLYDKRLQKLIGHPYVEYQRVTGLIWPPVYRAPRGAAGVMMPAPRHWRRPIMHLPGVVVGVALAALYHFTINTAHYGLIDAARTAAIGLMGALMVGLVLGRVCSPMATDWEQQQTDLSTTVALSAVVGVSLWIVSVWWQVGTPPNFAIYLPLWFIVQYCGHLFAIVTNSSRWAVPTTGT